MKNKTSLKVVGHKRASDSLFIVKAEGWIPSSFPLKVELVAGSNSSYSSRFLSVSKLYIITISLLVCFFMS